MAERWPLYGGNAKARTAVGSYVWLCRMCGQGAPFTPMRKWASQTSVRNAQLRLRAVTHFRGDVQLGLHIAHLGVSATRKLNLASQESTELTFA